MRPPPVVPILPPCPPSNNGASVVNAPAPSHRVPPAYPQAALEEGVEGQVTIVLDVYADGAETPRCISDTSPPGWFEDEAVKAVSQWQFAPAGSGAHAYSVTVKFKMMP